MTEFVDALIKLMAAACGVGLLGLLGILLIAYAASKAWD